MQPDGVRVQRSALFALIMLVAAVRAQDVGCILAHCGLQIVACETGASCRTTLACLNACSASPQKSVCQTNCTEVYADAVFDTLSTCMVQNQCFGPPAPSTCPSANYTTPSFNPQDLVGEWYTVKGLSAAYDCFDCQVYDISSGTAPYTWRYEWHFRVAGNASRTTVCNISMPDPKAAPDALQITYTEHGVPGLDHWSIVSVDESQSPPAYLFIYYCGSNAMMSGYQGGVLLSRAPSLDATLVQRARRDALAAGVAWDTMCDVRQQGC